MLGRTRYAPHFKIIGDTRGVHYGLFDCGPKPVVADPENGVAPIGSCC